MQKLRSDIQGFLLFTGIFIIVLFLDIAAVYFYYDHVQSFLNSQPEKLTGDAGIIFFGDYDEDGKILGRDSKHRAGKAITLYNSGSIKKVICVGGYNYKFWKGRPHLMKNFLVENHVAPGDIIYDSASFNTITNWREALKIIKRLDFDTIIAISAPLHIYRISNMIELPNTYFATYSYSLQNIRDYWILYKDVHHEFVSQILNRILKDELRNKLVFIYGIISNQFDKIF
jgi:vancomycin permeability regulator SanA